MVKYSVVDNINNRYQVIKTLSGGMGIVYLCIDNEQDNFPLAIKAIRPEFLRDIETRERFLHEANLWISFGYHPNIVQAYSIDYSYENHEIYILTELVQSPQDFPNPSLRSWIQAAYLTLNKSMQFALDVARGMVFVTGMVSDLVHRDLKPENILVGADEIAKVCDFGIASTIQKSFPIIAHSCVDGRSVTHSPIGTFIYMSPEQCLGQELDCRSDIYSFGLILYEMISGKFGIEGDSKEEILFNHINGQALDNAIANIPEPYLLNILQKCLNKEKSRRYSNWRELEEGLTNCYRVMFNQNPTDGAYPIDVGQYHIYQMASSYLAIGASYNDIGVIDKAIEFTKKACEIAQSLGAPRIEAAALSNLGLLWFNSGNYDYAIIYYEAALNINENLLDLQNKAINLGNLGGAYQKLGKIDEAREYFMQSFVIAESENNLGQKASQLGNLGISYAEQGELQKAITIYKNAIGLFENNNLTASAGMNYSNLANAYMQLGEFAQAEQYYQNALQISYQLGLKSQQGKILGNIANLYYAKREPEKGISALNQAIQISQESSDLSTLAINLGILGSIHGQLGNFQEAIDTLQKALEIAKQINNQKTINSIYLGLGNTHVASGSLESSLPHFEKSIEISRILKDKYTEASSMGNIGKVYSALLKYDEAEKYLSLSIQIADEIGSEEIKARGMWTLGVINEMKGDFYGALKLIQMAVPIFRKFNFAEYEQAAKHLSELRSLLS